jgi:hypothetical protein
MQLSRFLDASIVRRERKAEVQKTWEDVEDGSWMSPDFLRTYETRGASRRINEGENPTLELTVIP